MGYSYDPELHPPAKTADIDLSRPGTKVMLKVLVKTHKMQTEGFVPPAGVRVTRKTIADVPCFVAEPEAGGEHCMLYCHGGAFYLPVQAASLALACVYAGEGKLRVILPEYSLIPDCPAPAALEECRRVLEKTRAEVVYGESAGAAIAAMISGGSRGQMLIYPVTDDRSRLYPSAERYPLAVWTAASNRSMWEAYLRDLPAESLAYVVPMRRESWHGAAPAYIETQEFDILRDEGQALARQLEEAGVPVEYRMIPGSYHGFDGELTSPLVQRVLRDRIAWLRRITERK